MAEPKDDNMEKACCDGYGQCFTQTSDDEDGYEQINPCDCLLIKCPNYKRCKTVGPEWLLDCHEGYCASCAVIEYSHGKDALRRVNRSGWCQGCFKKLVPIGTARKNGRNHDDWDTRNYHKSCWLKLKRYL